MILAFILYLVSEWLNSLAGMCNAGMDKTETEIQYGDSAFKKYGRPEYWCKVTSAKVNGFIKGTKRRRDAWHDFKSVMIVADALSIVLVAIACVLIADKLTVHHLWLIIPYLTIHWTNRIQTFNFFYNKVFKIKSK